jgi:4-carboxymuconolactone decarboxylase
VLNLSTSEALGKMTEWEIDCRGANTNEIRAIIHVIGIYCGVLQALERFHAARGVIEVE